MLRLNKGVYSVGKTAEELAVEYYDSVWAEEHIKPAVDALPIDVVMQMDKLIQLREALRTNVDGIIVNMCELCQLDDFKECQAKKLCIDGVVNSNYVSD